jgi:hypothetical protein
MNPLLTLAVLAVIQLDDTFKPDNLPGSAPLQEALDPNHPESAATQTIIVYVGSMLSKVLVFAGTLTMVFLIVAGANYILAFGKDERIERGKRAMFWAIMGLVIIMASYAIVQAILQVVYRVDF